MWLLLGMLFVLGFIHTAFNLSLLSNRYHRVIYATLLVAGVFILFPWSKKLNIQVVDGFWTELSTLSLACTYQAFESITIMIISILLIRQHYSGTTNGIFQYFAKYLALFPSGIFLVGIFLLQTYAFNIIEETPFFLIAFVVAVAVFLILLLSSLITSKLTSSWEGRIEGKIILAFLQMLLAMFLPIIITGSKLQNSHFGVDIEQSAATLLILLMLFLLGLLWQKAQMQRNKS